MKFAYREYLTQLPGTSDFRLILRPVISIRIAGPRITGWWDALVDTGADETLLPRSLAELLEIELEEATSQAIGITGDKLTVHYGEVEFHVANADDNVTWRTTVGFVEFKSSDDEVIVLGHGGFLDYFTAKFDGERAELKLTPNSLLPRN